MPVNFPESTLQADPIGASDLRAVGEFKAPKADGGHQRVLDWTRRLQAADWYVPEVLSLGLGLALMFNHMQPHPRARQ